MFEKEIKKYYDALTPSDETRNALLVKIHFLRKKRAAYRLAFECFVSAAACFLFALIINYNEVSDIITAPDKWIGTALSEPNGYLIAGILLAVLIMGFVIIYRKNIRRINDEKRKDMHE